MDLYSEHPKFGKLPDGARLDTIKRSPNYSGDGFQNLISTPVLVDDRSFASEIGSDNGAELATYVVQKGKPLITLVK